MRNVLFVCTANICRSPMAETIFNALARDSGLPFHAESAGVSALEREPMAQKGPAKIWLLTEYAAGAAHYQEEISDPYGLSMSVYRASVRQLLAYLEPIVDRLSQQNRTF